MEEASAVKLEELRLGAGSQGIGVAQSFFGRNAKR